MDSLSAQYNQLRGHTDAMLDEIKRAADDLRLANEETKDLKDQLNVQKEETRVYVVKMTNHKKEIRKLEKENAELKEEIAKLKNLLPNTTKLEEQMKQDCERYGKFAYCGIMFICFL